MFHATLMSRFHIQCCEFLIFETIVFYWLRHCEQSLFRLSKQKFVVNDGVIETLHVAERIRYTAHGLFQIQIGLISVDESSLETVLIIKSVTQATCYLLLALTFKIC